jgi:hypothetical protein
MRVYIVITLMIVYAVMQLIIIPMYTGESPVTTVWDALKGATNSFTDTGTLIGTLNTIPGIHQVIEFVKAIWTIVWFDYPFFSTGYYVYFAYILRALSIGFAFGLILTIRGLMG